MADSSEPEKEFVTDTAELMALDLLRVAFTTGLEDRGVAQALVEVKGQWYSLDADALAAFMATIVTGPDISLDWDTLPKAIVDQHYVRSDAAGLPL